MEIYEMDRSEAEYFIENRILEREKEALKAFDEMGNLSGLDDEILEISSNSDDSDEESRDDSADDSSIKISQRNITSKINEDLFDFTIEEEDEDQILEREKEVKITELEKKRIQIRLHWIQLEKNLKEVFPPGLIPMHKHQKKINLLQEELRLAKRDLKDVNEKLKKSSAIEKKLHNDIKMLKSSIFQIKEAHKSEIKEFNERYKEAESARIDKLTQELSANHNKNLKIVCSYNENVVAELMKQTKILDDKNCYFRPLKYIPINEEKIRKETKHQYDVKLNEVLKLEKVKQDALFNDKFKKAVEDWWKEKHDEYIDKIKKDLEERFKEYVDEKKQELQLECEEKIKFLKERSEAEKNNYASELRESFQLKWKHKQKEIEIIEQKYENKILTLETEIQVLKESAQKEALDNQYMKLCFSDKKEAWEIEKVKLISSKTELEEKLSSTLGNEKSLLDKKEKYLSYIKKLKQYISDKEKRMVQQEDHIKKLEQQLQHSQLSL